MVVLEKIEQDISKKQLKKIGEKIRNSTATEEDFKIVSAFRSSHAPLIRILRDSLKNFKLKDENMLISRRIKRMPSIIRKLQRFKNMSLDRIQDLGGVRVILSDLNKVNNFANYLKNVMYKHKDKNNFLIIREKNYIFEPKDDGYRSIHHVYQYQGKTYPDLRGLCIELQIRTIKEHQWATAVEVLDMVQNSSLKTGIAESQYKTFFKLCSYAIAFIENGYKTPNEYNNEKDIKEIIREIEDLNNKYKIFDKLLSITVANKRLYDSFRDSDYLILRLDVLEKKVSYEQISNKETAELIYLTEENKSKNNPNIDVVMVSIDDLKSLITNHHFKWWFALCLKGNATSLRLKPYNWSAFRV